MSQQALYEVERAPSMCCLTNTLIAIQKGVRILEFITFYQNALHLTRVHFATFYQSALRHEEFEVVTTDVTPPSSRPFSRGF